MLTNAIAVIVITDVFIILFAATFKHCQLSGVTRTHTFNHYSNCRLVQAMLIGSAFSKLIVTIARTTLVKYKAD